MAKGRTPAPISDTASGGIARRARAKASNRATRAQERTATAWAAPRSVFVPPGLRDKSKPKQKPMSHGEAFTAALHSPLNAKGERILATKQQRYKLASAQSAKRQRLADLGHVRALGMALSKQPVNKTDAVPKYYPYTQTSAYADPASEWAIVKIKNLQSAGKINAAEATRQIALISPKQRKRAENLQTAGLVAPLPSPSFADKLIMEPAQALLHSPQGALMMAQHPLRTFEQMPGQILSDLKDWRNHPGFAAFDIASLASVGAGSLARAGAIGRVASAARAGEITAGQALYRGAKAAAFRPVPGHRTLRRGGAEVVVPGSENPLVRAGHRVIDRLHPEVSARTFAHHLEQNQRVENYVRRSNALALEHEGRKLNPGQQVALRAVEEQIHPADGARFYARKVEKAKSAVLKRRYEKQRRRWQEAVRYTEVRNGQLELTPELQKYGTRIRSVTHDRQNILAHHDLLTPERMAERVKGPQAVMAEELGTMQPLGKPRGYVSHQIEQGALPGSARSFGAQVGARMQKPGSLKEFTGEAMQQGLVPGKTTRSVARSGLEAAKIDNWFSTYGKIRESAVASTDAKLLAEYQKKGSRWFNRKYVALKPTKKLSTADKAALEQLRRGDIEGDAHGHLIDLEQQHIVSKDAARQLNKAGVKFVPRRVVQSLRPEIGGAPSTPLKRIVDTINQATVTGMLFLGSKYVVVNAPGQEFLMLTKQGFLQPVNIARAVYIVRHVRPETRAAALDSIGGGLARSVVQREGGALGAVTKIHGGFSKAYGAILDTPPRFSALTHEAFRRGYRTPEDWDRLFSSRDSKVVNDRNVIVRTANDDMIDYERLGPHEREITRRLLLFYPWLKGATRYTGRYLKEHPVQAEANILAGRQAQEQQLKDLGQVPSWMAGVIRVGTEHVPGLGNVPKVIDPTSASIITQGPQIYSDIVSELQGHHAVGSYGSPALQVGGAALGYNLGRGQTAYGRTPWDRAKNAFMDTQPLVNLERVLTSPRNTDQLYPRSKGEQIGRSLLLGGFQPSPVNPAKQADYFKREQREALSPPDRVHYDIQSTKQQVTQAYKRKGINLSPAVSQAFDYLQARKLARIGKDNARDKLRADADTAVKLGLWTTHERDAFYEELTKASKPRLDRLSTHMSYVYRRRVLTRAGKISGVSIPTL